MQRFDENWKKWGCCAAASRRIERRTDSRRHNFNCCCCRNMNKLRVSSNFSLWIILVVATYVVECWRQRNFRHLVGSPRGTRTDHQNPTLWLQQVSLCTLGCWQCASGYTGIPPPHQRMQGGSPIRYPYTTRGKRGYDWVSSTSIPAAAEEGRYTSLYVPTYPTL